MNLSLYEIIRQAQQGETKSIEYILLIFSKQLKSYSRKAGSEDMQQDLFIFLLELIPKLPMERDDFKNEKIILAYISKNIKNEYIRLSKKKSMVDAKEVELSYDFEICYNAHIEDGILMKDLFRYLKQNEIEIINLIYFSGFSVKEIAKKKQVTRQAINKIKNHALSKLRWAISMVNQLQKVG